MAPDDEPSYRNDLRPWVFAFPAEPTVIAGASSTLHVAATASRVRLHWSRLGERGRWEVTTGWTAATGRPLDPGLDPFEHRPYEDWSRGDRTWPAIQLRVPAQCPGGAYRITVESSDGAQPAEVLVVVRSPESTAAVLYKLPLFTYHAYNVGPVAGPRSWCLYTLPPEEPCRAVSWRRPGGGLGGIPWDLHNSDPFDPTPRQTVVHWDERMLRWFDAWGQAVDVCTDLDLHRDPDLLERYRLMVSAGHDEYWSDPMRDAIDRFVARGGNAAFFGGNTSWWRIEVDDEAHRFRRLGRWCDVVGREEVRLLGAGFANGGERHGDGVPTPVGYRVQHAGHWAYRGTGLRDGDTFGDGAAECLVGYECDGAHLDRAALAGSEPVRPTGTDGTPHDVVILGLGDLAPAGWGTGSKVATMVVRDGDGQRGTVFDAATTDWPRVLDLPGRSGDVVRRITHNVIDRLGR